MALTKTPVCEFGKKAPPFRLLGVDGDYYDLTRCRGKKGLLVMFICNHCPYVKTALPTLLEEARILQEAQIGCVAISANDASDYPEDSYENMQKIAREKHFPFPYLWDKTQAIAKAYGAVCTPDVFGYNSRLQLQYRGSVDERALTEAMQLIASTGKGPEIQIPSRGCSIKWRETSADDV